jgi:hypothetical protein
MAQTAVHSSEAMLEALVKIGDALRQLAEVCRSSSTVSLVQRGFDVRDYSGRLTFEAHVDAELHAGSALSWWFELSCQQQQWGVLATVNRITRSGQDTISVFADFEDVTFETVIERLDAILAAMRQSVEKVLA